MVDYPEPIPARQTVVVVGGGIAGLSAAHRLLQSPARPTVLLLESRNRVGGLLHTIHRDGFLIEEAADSIAVSQVPWVSKLCHEIGMDDQFVPTQECQHQALVQQRGRLLPIPPGFMLVAPTRIWPLVTTQVLTLFGKLRLALEPFIPAARDMPDESVAGFACRRLGRQAYERLVRPVVESIYSADPDHISLAAALPRFAEMERQFGSLYLAARNASRKHRRADSGGSHSLAPQAPREGMSCIVEALARQLPDGTIKLNTRVEQIMRQNDKRWNIVATGDVPSTLIADSVILATPAEVAAQTIRSIDEGLARELDIEYSQTIHVTLGYKCRQLTRSITAHGVFVPKAARRRVRSMTLCSEKFPNRAPQGIAQIRAALTSPAADSSQGSESPRGPTPLPTLEHDELARIAAAEVAPLLGIQGTPIFHHVVHHRQALPQYQVGHLQRVARIESLLAAWPGLALAGASYRGIGVPQCIRSGQEAADQVLQYLRVRGTIGWH